MPRPRTRPTATPTTPDPRATGATRAPQWRMLDVVLVAPQIAPNTGNIIRLCANVGARLHLVRPLAFDLDGAALKRGGLDYHDLVDMQIWDSWRDCRTGMGSDRRWFATTTRAPHVRYDAVDYRAGDAVVFGCEAVGLSDDVLGDFTAEQRL